MYIDKQSYNTFIYKCEDDKSLKSLLLDDMNFSLRFISNIKNSEYILTVNDKDRPKNGMLKKGDIIKILLKDEKSEYVSQKKEINILYEDEDLLILDKPPYIVSHPTKSHLQDTILNYAQAIFDEKNIKSKVRFISRLDRDTSGIISIAKNSYAHYILSQGVFSKCVEKYYLAVVSKNINSLDKCGTINANIKKSDDGIKRIICDDGQTAITHYKLIDKCENYALLELLLETGRTHQIRVHLSHINTPIIGDELYGGDMSIIKRQALHCHKLKIISPRSKKQIVVKSSICEDIKEVLNQTKLNTKLLI